MKPISGRFSYADNVELKAHFGLRKEQKLPRMGHAPIIVEGWLLWIEPITGPGKMHRILTKCRKCNKVFSAGRIAQHVKVHPED